MFKKLMFTVCLLTIFSTIQATPILYTFEGSMRTLSFYDGNTPANTVSIEEFDVVYELLIDMDAQGLKGRTLQSDILNAPNDYNYGSAEISENTVTYFNIDDISYGYHAFAVEVDVNIVSDIDYANEITFLNTNTLQVLPYSLLQIRNEDISGFRVGDEYKVLERSYVALDNRKEVWGSVTLVSMVDPSKQSVPEPGSLTMMASSLVVLSGLGFRKKYYRKK